MATIIKRRAHVADSTETDITNGVEEGSALKGLAAAGGVEIEVVPSISKDALALEKFMAEVVEVQMIEPSNDNEPAFVEVTVNGDYRCLPRDGNTYKVRRYHLAALTHAKSARVSQKRITSSDGVAGYQEVNTTSASYPFAVVDDPNPRGREWLKALMRSPA